MTWQPIETAPVDRTHIIAFSPLIDHLQETWWVDEEDKWSNWDFIGPPTYWMPMPELPEEE